jgi:hypothetical protein
LEEAKDGFLDALVIYYEKELLGNTTSIKQEKAYLLGIYKHLWIKRTHKKSRMAPLEETQENKLVVDKEQIPSFGKLAQFLESARKKCMELLSAFYYEKLPMEVKAEKFKFSGIRSATVQKYKCLKKVRETVT